MTTRNIQIALLAVLVIAFISCRKKQTTPPGEPQVQINDSLQQIVADEVLNPPWLRLQEMLGCI